MNHQMKRTIERLTFLQELFDELAEIASVQANELKDSSDSFRRGLAVGRRIAYELAASQAKTEIAGFNFIAAQEVK
jgi:hypothetical protein